MKQRGRKSGKATLAVIDGRRGSRPNPPGELSEFEAAVWSNIVGSMPADWFGAEAIPLLLAYCKHSAVIAKIDKQIDSVTDDDLKTDTGLTRYGKLATMRDKQTRVLLTISRSMRLTQSSVDPKTAGVAKRRGKAAGAMPWDD